MSKENAKLVGKFVTLWRNDHTQTAKVLKATGKRIHYRLVDGAGRGRKFSARPFFGLNVRACETAKEARKPVLEATTL